MCRIEGSASVLPLIQEICCYLSKLASSSLRVAANCSIIERTSGFVLISETTATKYLKLVTLTAFCLFTLIPLWLPLMLICINLFYSVLISSLYLEQVLSRLLTKASSSCSSSARASMSSANHRLKIILAPLLTFPLCSSTASVIILSRKILRVWVREGSLAIISLLF